MAVCRVNKSRDYTVMSNRHLRDKNLSLKAKGLLSVVLSLPDDWDYSVSGLCAVCGEGETAIKSALKELKSNGYLTVTKVYPGDSSSGRIEYVYDFFENNDGRVRQNQEIKKQGLENLPLESLGLEIDLLPNSNNNIINTKEPNTEYQFPLNPQTGENKESSKKEINDSSDSEYCKMVASSYNSICKNLVKVQKVTEKRKRAIKKAKKDIEEFGGWEKYFEKINESDYLNGKVTNWNATFDWVLNPTNMVKIMEGNYDNKRNRNYSGNIPSQSDYDEEIFFEGVK